LNVEDANRMVLGRSYTIDELINRMISRSDNEAANLLDINIDILELRNILQAILFEQTHTDDTTNFLSVKNYASFFRILFNASYLNKTMSEKALSYLAILDFPAGIAAGIPKGIPEATKFGYRKFMKDDILQLHDCGIIYYPAHPYLLCVMTRGTNLGKLTEIIRDISFCTFSNVDSQVKGTNN
jgi:beta-lactamase class A